MAVIFRNWLIFLISVNQGFFFEGGGGDFHIIKQFQGGGGRAPPPPPWLRAWFAVVLTNLHHNAIPCTLFFVLIFFSYKNFRIHSNFQIRIFQLLHLLPFCRHFLLDIVTAFLFVCFRICFSKRYKLFVKLPICHF